MSHTAAAQTWIMAYWLWAMAQTMDVTTGWSRTGKHFNLSLISGITGRTGESRDDLQLHVLLH